jgi:hypothetical protein
MLIFVCPDRRSFQSCSPLLSPTLADSICKVQLRPFFFYLPSACCPFRETHPQCVAGAAAFFPRVSSLRHLFPKVEQSWWLATQVGHEAQIRPPPQSLHAKWTTDLPTASYLACKAKLWFDCLALSKLGDLSHSQPRPSPSLEYFSRASAIALLFFEVLRKKIPNGHIEQPLPSLGGPRPTLSMRPHTAPVLALSKTTTKLLSAPKFEKIRVCPQFYIWLSPKACQTTWRS